MSQSDPTDHALAAIASIMDKPETHAEPASSPYTGTIDGYTRLGPGPIHAIRFKWTARRDANGDFYVDETIGDHSQPITTGPMSEQNVVPFIEARERETNLRFEQIRSEIAARSSSPPLKT